MTAINALVAVSGIILQPTLGVHFITHKKIIQIREHPPVAVGRLWLWVPGAWFVTCTEHMYGTIPKIKYDTLQYSIDVYSTLLNIPYCIIA